jgi:hypothetical protein
MQTIKKTFNAKVKAFRAKFGVRDILFFLFRLANIDAQPTSFLLDPYSGRCARFHLSYPKSKNRLPLPVRRFSNKYGSYLLSRIVVQYHRP